MSEESNPYQPHAGEPAVAPLESPNPQEGDATGGVIPYKNPQALVAYYLGLFSLAPIIGFFIGIASIVLGVQGWRFANRNPKVKGKVHAGIGIGCGLIGVLISGLIIVAIISAIAFS